MKNQFHQKLQRCALGLTIFTFAVANLAQAEVVVIVNPANSASLDKEQIAKIFLGQSKTFPGGSEAIAVDQPSGSTREDFGNKVLEKIPGQLKALWARQIFTGGAKPPKELGGDDEVMKFVASTPGGIGYVDSAKANKTVKIVKH
jgi:ABC-type phosphate transport system substrate-binding protein